MTYHYKIIGGTGELDPSSLASDLDQAGQNGFRLVAHEMHHQPGAGWMYLFVMEKQEN